MKKYTFGFNGKEFDPEWHNSPGTMYDYGFRIYDPRIAKFLSADPLTASYPMLTPYQFASNSPIRNIDLDGLEATDAQKKYVNGQIAKAYLKTAKAHAEGQYLNRFNPTSYVTEDVIQPKENKVSVPLGEIREHLLYDQKFKTRSGEIVKGKVNVSYRTDKEKMIIDDISFSKKEESVDKWKKGYYAKFKSNDDIIVYIKFENSKDLKTYKQAWRDKTKETYLNYVKENQSEKTYKAEKEYIDKTGKLPTEYNK